MANIINNQTKTKVADAPEYVPEGPALLSDPAVHRANIDQRLEAIKENRDFWARIEPPKSKKDRLIPAKAKAIGATIVAAGTLAATDNMPFMGGETPQKTRVVTVQPGERLANVVNRAQGGDEEIRPEVSRLKNEIGTDITPGQKVEVRVED